MTENTLCYDSDWNNNSYNLNDDDFDKETIDNSFYTNSFTSDRLKINDKSLFYDKKKHSISYFNNENMGIFDGKICNESQKRVSEQLPQNLINLLENYKKGPNVNIKLPKKNFNTKEERVFFKNLIANKQKTELCKNWTLYKDCYYKDTCSFAHGEKEMRTTITPIKYKTKICKAFAEKYYCNYGNRCHYSHKIRESKKSIEYNIILQQFRKEFEFIQFSNFSVDFPITTLLEKFNNKTKW